jgi:hypothetical protein
MAGKTTMLESLRCSLSQCGLVREHFDYTIASDARISSGQRNDAGQLAIAQHLAALESRRLAAMAEFGSVNLVVLDRSYYMITVTVHLTQTEARCRCVRMGGQVECTVTVIP